MTEPRAGDKFIHATFLDPDWTPGEGQTHRDAPHAVCTVTTVRHGRVYYNYAWMPPSARSAFVLTLDKWPGRHVPLTVDDEWVYRMPDGTAVNPARYLRRDPSDGSTP